MFQFPKLENNKTILLFQHIIGSVIKLIAFSGLYDAYGLGFNLPFFNKYPCPLLLAGLIVDGVYGFFN
jgi:hypothetical protein